MTVLRGWLHRVRRWAKPYGWGLAVVFAALLTSFALVESTTDPQPASDGAYMWLYARSIAFDHDIDFTNDYALCGDSFKHNKDRGGGHPDNPFYVGPSLFWVPAIELARVIHRFPPETDEATRLGCKGPIVTTALGVGVWVEALLLWLSYLAARRFVDDYVAAIATALFAFGTTLCVYATYASSYSHVYDGACVAALVLLSLRAYEEPRRTLRWALAGVALAACILHRPTNAPLGLIPATYACVTLRGSFRDLGRALAALIATSAGLGLLPLVMIYKYLYGKYFGIVPQGQYFMQPAHPHVWLLLFAPKGLFFLAPVAWVSVAGGVMAFRAGARSRVLVLLVAFAVDLYLSSIPLDWDASSTVGARRLLPMTALLVVLAALPVARAVTWMAADAGRVRGLLAGLLVLPLAFVSMGQDLYCAAPEHYYDFYPSQEALYGDAMSASWREIDRRIGAIAILPAQAAFALRYGLPHQAYWVATDLYWFLRDPQTMRFRRSRLDLNDKNLRAATTGFERDDDGAKLREARGTIVFCAGWSYATDLVVVASAPQPAVVRVSSRSFLGVRTRYGSLSLDPTESTTKLSIPRRTFDSGVVELVFESDSPSGIHVRSVELLDTHVYAPVK